MENLQPGGKIYVLGGEKAVESKFADGLEAYNVVRLEGSNRYKTNIEVLKETGLKAGSKILVCTGLSYADNLSASATGLPILMVPGTAKLQAYHKEYLQTLGTNNEFIIIGGTNAVNDTIAKELEAYGTVDRVYGKNRYVTAVEIAKMFFGTPKAAVIVTGTEFADGLCGGLLAYNLKAPLLLTYPKREADAANYIKSMGIEDGYILGGEKAVPNDSGLGIFNTDKIIDTTK